MRCLTAMLQGCARSAGLHDMRTGCRGDIALDGGDERHKRSSGMHAVMCTRLQVWRCAKKKRIQLLRYAKIDQVALPERRNSGRPFANLRAARATL